MKLTDLNPKFFTSGEGDDYLGLTFECPHCRVQRLGVWFSEPVVIGELDGVIMSDHPKYERLGDLFETMTLSPSVDCSGSGHWHGSVTNGEVA